MTSTLENPFGVKISTNDIIDTLTFFDNWQDRYKYIIDLGKELPSMDERLRTEERIVKGCQSQVWIDCQGDLEQLSFHADSDAHIVRGLLGVVLAAYNGKSAQQVLDFDIEAYFQTLDLLKHLSPSRGNGLKAMVERIQQFAQIIKNQSKS